MPGVKAVKDNAKKKSLLYKERDEGKREEFFQSIKDISADRLIWVDECGVEERIARLYGRSNRGERVYGEISGKRTHNRMSVIAAYCQKKLMAPFRFEGYTNTDVFEAWVDQCLIPLLQPGHVVILDNASFHKAPYIKDKIEATGAKVIFLPPYSPDINKIEPQWAVLKSKIKKYKHLYQNFFDNLDQQLISMCN